MFFIPAILPDFDKNSKKTEQVKTEHTETEQVKSEQEMFFDEDGISLFGLKNIKNIGALDSIQQALPKEKKLSFIKYAIYKKALIYNQIENLEKIKESLVHNFPKAIFLYMPIFAFWLWLFHSKKKWLYFDHGIYTLHCFSFSLLAILMYIIAHWLLSIFHIKIPSLIKIAIFAYFIYYFFHSHRRMYQESKAVSRLICTALFFINTVCMFFFLFLYLLAVVLVSV